MENNISLFKVGDKLLNEHGDIVEIKSVKFYSKEISYIFRNPINYEYEKSENYLNKTLLSQIKEKIEKEFENSYRVFVESMEILNKMKEKINLKKEAENAN